VSPMSERLELRLDEETIRRVDVWRSNEGDIPSRSEAIRRLIDVGLADNTKEGFRLNNTDKLVVWMLSEIMKNQIKTRKEKKDDPYDMKTVNLIQEAVYGGHFWALGWEMPGVIHDHVDDRRKVSTVVNILDAWSFIEGAYEDYDAKTRATIEKQVGFRGKNPTFLGFDGNNETEYLSIARFLVETLGRFQRFKGREFNSHLPTASRYSRMARLFEDIRKKLGDRRLSPTEMIELLKVE